MSTCAERVSSAPGQEARLLSLKMMAVEKEEEEEEEAGPDSEAMEAGGKGQGHPFSRNEV